ncbi:MAG: hypothetical protein A2Y38_25765 [Spirochaetes bacterium GWB1_59_5]|nr:MAG: hypothetical protein A2Y38_25765 [Spirochaetes bacterium GWB1_59_5]
MTGTSYNGNAKPYLMDRLHRLHPELHARVVAGELTAHAAAVEAGWRPKTVSMRVDDPRKLSEAIRRHVKPEDVAELARILAADAA